MYYNIMLKLIFPQTHFGAVKVVSQGYVNKVTYVYRHTWRHGVSRKTRALFSKFGNFSNKI